MKKLLVILCLVGALNSHGGPVFTPPNETQATWAIPQSDIEWTKSRVFSKTLSANTTFTFTGAADGAQVWVYVTNTASNYTVTWPTVSWVAATAPTQTTGAHTDRYIFTKVGNTIYGEALQNF